MLTNNVFARRVIDQRFDGVAENCERFVDVYGLCARHALRAARTDALAACTRTCIHYECIIIKQAMEQRFCRVPQWFDERRPRTREVHQVDRGAAQHALAQLILRPLRQLNREDRVRATTAQNKRTASAYIL